MKRAGLSQAAIEAAWARYEAAPQSIKDAAARRLAALSRVAELEAGGAARMEARSRVATELREAGVRGGCMASLGRWAQAVAGVERQHWLALLAPAYVGRTATAAIPVDAWDAFKADYLRLEAPTAAACYERLQRRARREGWTLPAVSTFRRRLERELSSQAIVLAREGSRALDPLFPSQERDRSGLHALQAVNADGHRFDVFVRQPDGRIVRPILVGVQDVYSGKLLGWRLGETESADLARLAFRDVIENFGIMEHAWLDNGRGFASKMLTGGAPNRYRFKVKSEEPTGVLVSLGVKIHWTIPCNAQAKPIERAWRDLCDRIARHPACAGAYTGNKPSARPENSGTRAVDWDAFVRLVDDEIAAHNARPGRLSRTCRGRSFDDVFAESYGCTPVRRATTAQLRLMLLSTDAVRASPQDGSIRLAGNRYWSEDLVAHRGARVLARFDSASLHTAIHVYTQGNAFIATAGCVGMVGFADTQAAREHARAKQQHRRAARLQLAAERRMDAASVAALIPTHDAPERPTATVIRPVFGRGSKAVCEAAAVPPACAEPEESASIRRFGLGVSILASQRNLFADPEL